MLDTRHTGARFRQSHCLTDCFGILLDCLPLERREIAIQRGYTCLAEHTLARGLMLS